MNLETTSLIISFLSSLAVGYIYFGYPVLVMITGRLFPREVAKGEMEPTVTIIITAYNEERDISRKLENTLSIDYPPEKLEILVASDGSTDRTDDIALQFRDWGVKLFRQEGRLGKTYTQNKAVEQAGGDIIVYGGARFVSGLLQHGLIDEYHLFLNPVAIGKGLSIFNGLEHDLKLKLADAKAFPCGVVVLVYRP